MVRAALSFDVVADGLFAAMLSDRSDEVTIRPELSAPQLLFDLWTTGKDLAGGDALDGAHDLE